MTWAQFKQLTIEQHTQKVAEWKAGQDAAGATELAADFVDNVLLRFPDGSAAEKRSDLLLAMLGPALFAMLGANLAELASAGLNVRPLANLPF